MWCIRNGRLFSAPKNFNLWEIRMQTLWCHWSEIKVMTYVASLSQCVTRLAFNPCCLTDGGICTHHHINWLSKKLQRHIQTALPRYWTTLMAFSNTQFWENFPSSSFESRTKSLRDIPEHQHLWSDCELHFQIGFQAYQPNPKTNTWMAHFQNAVTVWVLSCYLCQ